jgi:hypothetical protein
MTLRSYHRQRNDHSRAGQLVGRCGRIPVDGRWGVSSPGTDAYSRITGGASRPVLFILIARNRSSRLLEHRRRAQGFSLPLAHGSVATQIHAQLIGVRSRSVFQHFVRQDLDVLEAHVERLSSRVGFNRNQHSERQITREQEPVASGARSV